MHLSYDWNGKMRRALLLLLLGLSLSCICLPSPAWQDQNPLGMAFAYSDLTGARLLSVDTPVNSAALVKAVFAEGLTLNVKFLRQQKSAANWNGRQTARDFDQSAGSLFQVEGGKTIMGKEASIGEECLLVTEQFLRERKRLSVRSDPTIHTSNAVLRRVERAKGKKVSWEGSIARIGATGELILVRFIPDGKTCLASLVLVTPDSIAFDDYEAKYDADVKGFVWRVDTDGIDAESFHVLAAFEGKQGIEIAVLWDASEGQDLYLLRSEGAALRPLFRSYRYCAPI